MAPVSAPPLATATTWLGAVSGSLWEVLCLGRASGLQSAALGLGPDRSTAGPTVEVETLPLQPDGTTSTVSGQLGGRPDRDVSRRPRERAGHEPLDDQDDPTGTGGAPGTGPRLRSGTVGEHRHRAVGLDPSQRADPVRRSPRRTEAADHESPRAARREGLGHDVHVRSATWFMAPRQTLAVAGQQAARP